MQILCEKDELVIPPGRRLGPVVDAGKNEMSHIVVDVCQRGLSDCVWTEREDTHVLSVGPSPT